MLKTFHIALLFFVLGLACCGCAFAAGDLSRSEAAPMEAWLSRFMDLGRENVRFGSPEKAAEARKILSYALRIAQIDGPGNFQACPKENCPYGALRVEKRFVDDAIKRYFGHDPDKYPLLAGKGAENFERGYYHGAELEKQNLKPRLREAKLQPVGLVLMRGDVLDHMGESIDKFTALAWPSRFGSEDSWALVSLVFDSAKK